MSLKQLEKIMGTLDSLENQQGVITFTIGKLTQSLTIPKKFLPAETKVGDVIYLNLVTEKEEIQDKKQLAYNILEEILKGENYGSRKKRAK